jgi:hypothetical protein
MTRYRITSETIKGEIFVEYMDGYLTKVEFILSEPLNYKQFGYFFANMNYHEQFLLQHGIGKAKVEEVVMEAANVKIARFCEAYLKHKKVPYKVSASDAGKIKLVEMPASLLEHYFKSDNFLFKSKQSIGNYVRYYNELRAEAGAKAHQQAGKQHKDLLKQGVIPRDVANKMNERMLNNKV